MAINQPVDGFTEIKDNIPHLYCSNVDEHKDKKMVLIFSSLKKETLLNLAWADSFIHYRQCPECKREVLWPVEATQR